MKKKSTFTFLLLLVHLCFSYAQQIVTDSSLQPQQLIDNLTSGSCTSATNAFSSINGSINNIPSYGFFSRGTSEFPLENGIVLSTGNVNSSGNTLIAESLSDGDLEWNTDPDIETILGLDQTLNATSLEFDFTSVNTTINFKYVFASDEYQQQYPCNFQDVFAILIKEAGSTDPYVNIALVPESLNLISTSSIHPEIPNGCNAESENFFEGYNINTTNFDGHTVALNAITNVSPGIIYHVKFVIADHIDQRFDSAVFIEAESFGASVDLGPDITACGSSIVLDGSVDNNSASYKWFKDNIEIIGETSPTLPVIEYGEYEIEVTIPLPNGSCTMTDSVIVDVIPFQQAAPISDILVCDEIPYDGIGLFDLTTKNDEIMQNLPSSNFLISYHLSQDDALDGLNPIISDYENNGSSEPIYVRIESIDESCLQVGTFNVEVGEQPNYNTIPPIILCSDLVIDGVGYVELNYYAFEIANYEFNRTVTFHITETDAYSGLNSITYATDVPFGSTYAYARITNDFTGCFSVIPITLLIQDELDYTQNLFIDLCLPATEQSAVFDLQPIKDEVIAQFPNASVLFYTSYQNAMDGTLPIFGTFYQNEVPYYQTIYMGVRELNQPCSTILELELHTNLAYNVVRERSNINRCDDSSNDNILDFDLIEVSNELKGEYELDLTFYNSAEDRNNGINPINLNIPYTVTSSPHTIYTNASNNGCESSVDVSLNINPLPDVQPQVIEYCGNPNIEEGYTTIQLSPLINTISETYENATINLFATEDDALIGENTIQNSFDAIGDTPILYVRITDNRTQCYDITTLQVDITDGIAIATPEPIIICDDDNDNSATVNLESVLPQLSNDLSSVSIQFFDSNDNAVRDRNPITNPDNYTTENIEIFIRIDAEDLDCFVIVSFNVLIYINPQLNIVSDYINCEIEPSGNSDFFLLNKDEEIINGQIGMEVFYFRNENDAINKENPIDKTQAYTISSNPETLYVRLENERESSCYKVAPFLIAVQQAPIFIEPTDIFKCNYNGNGLNTVDFNEKIIEITDGALQDLNVSFHLTPLNANLGANSLPLEFTTTENPQLIYTRIENNDTSCYEVSTFNINTLALPEVSYGHSLVSCGNNYQLELLWDLTEIELLVLEGRQYGLEFTYFESEEDVVTNTNQIPNPENYTNTIDSQTLYVKVRNISTDCFSSVPFSLIINTPPIINPIENINICVTIDRSINLLDFNEVLLEDTYNTLISYHTNEAEAEANINAISGDYMYTNSIESLYVRAEYSTTHCYAIHPFQLIVNPLPTANQPSNLVGCDDDFDSFLQFDLSQQNAAILNGQNPDEFSVSYFNSEFNAIENEAELNTNYSAYNDEIIYVRIENNTTGCFDITQFSIIVNPIPTVSIENQVVCLNDLPLVVSAETNNALDTYLWSTNASSPEIEIFETGNYSVTITNQYGCAYTSIFNVTESESATIDVIETIDFSDPNNIIVTVDGIGDYQYQLNNGNIQASNVFENVPIGYNTITIIDQNGCSQITREVLVIDAPKHMTPNSDGEFDTWHIAGVETLPGTVIYIFDRFGKLLKELNHNSLGWDGTYNGNKMPTGDYWYVAKVIQNGMYFEVKGHFTLRR